MKKKSVSRFFKKREPPVPPPVPPPVVAPVPAPAPAPTPTYMDASTSTGQPPSIYQYLGAAKEILQGSGSNANIVKTALGEAEVRALEQDAFEVLRLIKSRKNGFAPINRIPPEVLSLIPDFWSKEVKDRATIALTRVCRAWRAIFTSRSALWTDFDCKDIDKSLVYLNRSGSVPINVRLDRNKKLSPYDPFLQVVPHIITRLKSLSISATSGNLQEIIAQLSQSAPLLASLAIETKCQSQPQHCPDISPTLFNGDLSPLRELRLECIRTTLPWRNMINLTSFTLKYTTSGDSSVWPFLDFFESAPNLRKILLHFATPTFDTHTGRLVSLEHLRRMDIIGGNPSPLLNHLLVPVSAELAGPFHPPTSCGCLWQLSGFTIHVGVREICPTIRFGGPDGHITVVSANPQPNTTCRVFESLAQVNPSNIEQLTLTGGDLMERDGCIGYWVLFCMKRLRTLTILDCDNLSRFISCLVRTDMCPELEELVLDARLEGGEFDLPGIMEVAKVRASMAASLKSLKIGSRDIPLQTSVSGLKRYIPHVECGPLLALESDDTDGGYDD